MRRHPFGSDEWWEDQMDRYDRHNRRMQRFGCLIVAAVIAACIGVVAGVSALVYYLLR